MANPERGEVELVAGATTYTLVLSFNAICEMQSRTQRTYGQLLSAVVSLDYVALREVTWQLLRAHHAKAFPTLDSVGDLIEQIGVQKPVNAFKEIINLNAAKGKAATGEPPAQT